MSVPRKVLDKFVLNHYVRSEELENVDYKTYDNGSMVYATGAQSNTDAIGEIYVEYDIEFT